MYQIINCYTCPEIEILLILYNEDMKSYKKSNLKPSEFCKKHYNYSKKKDEYYFTNNFDIDELIEMLQKYDSYKRDDEYSIYSLVTKE